MPETSSAVQMSDARRTLAFLTLSGGFQDAYTYMGRGRVFANAQTGNIVLLGVNLCEGQWGASLRYLLPVLAFAAGVYAAAWVRGRAAPGRRLHWRQAVLAVEIVLLAAVGFMPPALDLAANVLVSFSLCDAGAGLPQAARHRLRKHHVHRQPAQRHAGAV